MTEPSGACSVPAGRPPEHPRAGLHEAPCRSPASMANEPAVPCVTLLVLAPPPVAASKTAGTDGLPRPTGRSGRPGRHRAECPAELGFVR